jgi:hypothetical protein
LAFAFLYAGCSLRDVDQYSAGSEPLDVDAGCKPGGASCITAQECCSEACDGTCTACREIATECNSTAPVSGCCPGLSCLSSGSNKYTCQPENACSNSKDELALAGKDMSAVLRSCETQCGPSPAKCSECVANVAGLSPFCANCFMGWWYCLPLCGADCRTGSSLDCAACCQATCLPMFRECSGIQSCPAVSAADAG